MYTFAQWKRILVKAWGVATIICMLTFSLAIAAASGALDITFSGDGKLKLDVKTGVDNMLWDVAIQPDGKIVAVGDIRPGDNWNIGLARIKPGGGVDTAFSGDGKLVLDLNESEQGMGLIVDKDTGKILVAGQTCTASACDVAVIRYNNNGTLDTSFNTKGYRIDDYGGGDNGTMGAIVLQPDGKIVVGGYMVNSTTGNYDFAVYRYNTNGTLDTTFNKTGKKAIGFGSGRNDVIWGIVIQPGDGKILVAGSTCDASDINCNFAVARLNPNGSLDTSFNTTGKQTTDLGGYDTVYDIALQSDGKIVVSGNKNTSTNNYFAVVRYNPNGKLDTTFAGTGKKVFDFSGIGNLNMSRLSVEIQSVDNKIVVCGTSNDDFALARLTSSGALDKTFNGTGKVTVDFGGSDACRGLVIQPADGKYLLAGFSNDGALMHWALARVLP